MSETTPKDDELAGTEQPFVQHLMELRDRLVKAMIAIGTADAENKAMVAMNNLLTLSTEFIALAQNLGLMEVK